MTSRREFLIAAAGLWQAARLKAQEHQHGVRATKQGPYTFAFFSAEQQVILRLLIALIVPADERSTGAVGAKVDEYIDFILAHADAGTQGSWRNGLASFGKAQNLEGFLEAQAANEFDPKTDDEQFFVLLKSAVVEGFYTSEQGIEYELGYQGMGFVLDFKGCTHADHHPPAGWVPNLKQRENV